MRKTFILLAAICCTLFTFADAIKIGDLYYTFDSSTQTAEVATCPSDDKYTGDLVVPATVDYESVTYNVKSIASLAFANCEGLTDVNISNSIDTIHFGAFYQCTGLKSITIPDNVVYIAEGTFLGCSALTSVTLSKNIKFIGLSLFKDCTSLNSISIPGSVEWIGGTAFSGCTALKTVVMQSGVKEILQYAFNNCTALTKVIIPATVETIDIGAFQQCTSLNNIQCSALTPPECETLVFSGVNVAACDLYVPEESVELYKNANTWKEFGNKIQPMQTAIDQVSSQKSAISNQKVIRNGQLFIQRGDELFNLNGARVK
ncbi:MAG: leucine-rich repeat protein [Paludibacteraceae bacterium]|nr:leucine-rich repeat protein [Paludibacteraceae bacterium]